MGVSKTTTKEGTGKIPQKGQKVTIEYTGWLKDTSKPNNKGDKSVTNPALRSGPRAANMGRKVRLFRRSGRLRRQDRHRPGHPGYELCNFLLVPS